MTHHPARGCGRYRRGMRVLGEDLGWELAVDRIAAESVEAAFLRRWGHEHGALPRTGNAHRVRARSFMAFCRKRNWFTNDPMVRRRGPSGEDLVAHVARNGGSGQRDSGAEH